jgi:toxin YoeB
MDAERDRGQSDGADEESGSIPDPQPRSHRDRDGDGAEHDGEHRADYVDWHAEDRRIVRRINELLRDISRNGNEGIGKPEALKHGFHGYWSRRITQEHRLVHRIVGDGIRIAACRYHY